ncbi:hypothetical protein [Streptomyces sp. NPDC003710]
MAADIFEAQFTQIYNGLFRDPRLSFKAKGIFGLISTHRDGYGLSLESIAASATDGISGIRTGLLELIKFGYLTRDRQRDERGRLGESVYFITDMPDGLILLMNPEWERPAPQSPRWEPTCDFPNVDEPTEADHTRKKTRDKKTNHQNTSPVRSVQGPKEARGSDEAATRSARPLAHTTPRRAPLHEESTKTGAALAPAINVLNAIAHEFGPEYLLTGKPLTDQAQRVTQMLADGWTLDQIKHIVAGTPWPDVIETSRPAIIAARLRRACEGPPPAAAHTQTDLTQQGTWTPPAWNGNVITRWVECVDCGHPVQPGHHRCASCMDWPACKGHCGIPGVSQRRVDPADPTGLCSSCKDTAEASSLESLG